LVNYSLEAIRENLLTSSSTAWKVGARFNLLQAVQFFADIWRKINSKTIRNSFVYCGFKHSTLEMSNSYTENETIFEL